MNRGRGAIVCGLASREPTESDSQLSWQYES